MSHSNARQIEEKRQNKIPPIGWLEMPILSFKQVFEHRMRSILWRSAIITVILAVIFYFLVRAGIGQIVSLDRAAIPTSLSVLLDIVSGFVALFGFIYLLAPVMALAAAFSQDRIAEITEYQTYGPDVIGQPAPLLAGLRLALRFFLLLCAANLLLLFISFIPGINILLFLGVNAYFLGREYFVFAAMRHGNEAHARALRARHSLKIWLFGMAISIFLMIPLINLVTPVFATILMVHLHQKIALLAD